MRQFYKFTVGLVVAGFLSGTAFGSEIDFSMEEFRSHLSKRNHYAVVIKLSDPILFNEFRDVLKGREFDSDQKAYFFWVEEIAPFTGETYMVLERSSSDVPNVMFRKSYSGLNSVDVGDEALIFFDLDDSGNMVTDRCGILFGDVGVPKERFTRKDELIEWASNNMKSLCYTSGPAWRRK